jgi:hypothetical protein
MAISIHVARDTVLNVNAAGVVLRKDDHTKTLKDHMTGEMSHRVIEDANIPNSAGYPSVKTYLEAEAFNNYVLQHMDQNTIVTYLRNATAGFPG